VSLGATEEHERGRRAEELERDHTVQRAATRAHVARQQQHDEQHRRRDEEHAHRSSRPGGTGLSVCTTTTCSSPSMSTTYELGLYVIASAANTRRPRSSGRPPPVGNARVRKPPVGGVRRRRSARARNSVTSTNSRATCQG